MYSNLTAAHSHASGEHGPDNSQSPVDHGLLGSWNEVIAVALHGDTTTAEQRAAMSEQLRQDFREVQRLRRAKRAARVHALTLGKGLGIQAEQSLLRSCYNPAEVFGALALTEREMWIHENLCSQQTVSAESNLSACSRSDSRSDHGTGKSAESNAGGRVDAPDDRFLVFPLLRRMKVTTTPAAGIRDVQTAVMDNLIMLQQELDLRCGPFTFRDVLDTIVRALPVIERGDLQECVSLPMYTRMDRAPRTNTAIESSKAYKESSSPCSMSAVPTDTNITRGRRTSSSSIVDTRHSSLHDVAQKAETSEAKTPGTRTAAKLVGAKAVLDFVVQSAIPVAFRVVHVIHMVQWIGQYTMTFLRTVEAQDKQEATTRVELLAQCVRLLGMTENFSAVLLSIQSKVGEYNAFDALCAQSKQHVTELLDRVEHTLDAVMGQPFPSRRQRVRTVEHRLHLWLQRALFFLGEIHTSWTPNVHYHLCWKNDFLSHNYFRIHTVIASKFLTCTLGFVDEALYSLVRMARVPGHRYFVKNAAGFPPDIPNFVLVERKRVEERSTFAQISNDIKLVHSTMVGRQLCMSARYIMGQATAEYDKAWGFMMHEPTAAEEQEKMAQKVAQVVQHAQSRLQLSDMMPIPEMNTRDASEEMTGGATFLTQTDEM